MQSIPEAQFSDWTRRIRDGDRTAYAAVFHAAYPALARYVAGITRDGDAAQDVVQEVFVRIWKRRETLDPDRPLRALLYTSARNLALNRERKVAREQPLDLTMDDPSLLPTPEEDVDAEILGARLRVWIGEMPERRREAFQLSRFDGLSYAEIADVMGLSVKSVENHIRLALLHLRDRLRAYEPSLLKP